ncbi:LysR family transcriptional regulator [Amycolatopsis sp. PS_44_ISF1]|uniref:LysR family transcriptional regulator n=1 Tax=Amycolatopsis sp. PS_44_ISF1 TaxID=2974917 RepID=UPI0028DF7900|nr:LysR family transcriptional regulator [Amycolatopsis sp. PS_44_ISF1]MDT8913402.1 LysR family transcriptional regulator [Amycolatopsis sp. PS_44_ISF1]
METRQLEHFVAVAEELSFTRAAQRLFTVQSTVSATIRALETELGSALFDRSTRRVALSAPGLAFLPEAKAALEAVDRARAVVQETSAGLRGSLRIGTMSSIGALDLPALLGAFHRRHPLVDLHVTVSMTGSTGLAEDVRHGRLDLALLGLPEAELAGLATRSLLDVPYHALVPEDHELAGRAGVGLADLAGERFVDTPRGFGNRIAVDRAFATIGSPRRVTVEVADLRAVPGFVAAGLGIAVVPDVVPLAVPGTSVVPLTEAGFAWPLTAVSHAGRPPSRALRTLLDLLDEGGLGPGPYETRTPPRAQRRRNSARP